MEIRKIHTPCILGAVLLYIIAATIPSTNSSLSGIQKRSTLRAHWSQWSSWSSCSRTCGGGVSEQTRTCLRKRNRRVRIPHQSTHCVGLYKRYRMCNKRDCPEGSRPFREEQCDMYNTMPLMDRLYTWEALIKETRPCELHCRAQGQTFFAKLADKVIDGTPCRNDSDVDVCVDGMCKRVGCDGVLGSGLSLDKCGVCGGDNSDCQITREIFDKNDLSVGYHVIATIPVGAMYINMTEMGRSRNYLALQSTDEKPYINGGWHIDYPGNFTVAGTIFQYTRPSRTEEGEQITAMGPTTEAVDLMMIYQQANPGIYYEYTMPLHKPSDIRGVGGEFVVDNEESDYSSYSYYDVGEVPVPGVVSRPTGTHGATGPGAGIPQPGMGTNPRYPPPSGYPNNYPATGQDSSSGRYGSVVPIYEAVNASRTAGVPGQYPYGRPDGDATRYLPYSIPVADSPYNPRPYGEDGLGGPTVQRYPPRVIQPTRAEGPRQHIPAGQNEALKEPPIGTFIPDESSSDGGDGTNTLMYYWMDTGMAECSRSCAGGVQQSIAQCVDHVSLSPVEDNMCVVDWKPVPKTMACNTQPCPAVWTEGEWTECSTTCGDSRRIRQVLCKEQRTQSVITTVPFANCNETDRPTSVEECDVPSCASWEAGEWGECSVDCGRGYRRRRITCMQGDSEVSDSLCGDQTPPDDRQDCDMGSCIPEWMYSAYSETCSAECGTGSKSRNVICSTAGSAGAVSQEVCAGITRPRATKACNRPSCGAKWMTTEWSQCTSECGPGSQSRLVLCVSTRNGNSIVSDSVCRDQKPIESRDCNVRDCGSTWYTSDFGPCSRSCGGGTMSRIVKCLNEAFEPSIYCDDSERPSERDHCNPQTCVETAPPTGAPPNPSASPSDCRDKFSYCNKVARSRLCGYSYYSRLCCYSCYDQVSIR